MITLPKQPNRRELRAFWSVVSAAAGALAGVVVPGGGPTVGLVAAGIALASALPGWLRPRSVCGLYALWNRAARLAGRAAAQWVSLVAFYALVLVVGRGGSQMPWTDPGPEGSAWAPRPEGPGSLAAQHRRDRGSTAEPPRIGSLSAWAWDSGNHWALGLVPLLGLLRLLRPKAERSLGENIYTLY